MWLSGFGPYASGVEALALLFVFERGGGLESSSSRGVFREAGYLWAPGLFEAKGSLNPKAVVSLWSAQHASPFTLNLNPKAPPLKEGMSIKFYNAAIYDLR